MHGQGKLAKSDGTVYEGAVIYGNIVLGEFRDGKKHGQGTYTWKDKRKYVGMFENNKQHGIGMFYTAQGNAKKGRWDNGVGQGWFDAEGKFVPSPPKNPK